MFALESNLKGVIAQTERLIEAIPLALDAAWRPSLWLDDARDVAEQTLRGLANPEEERYIPDFVATVTASVLIGGGLSLKGRNPRRETGSVAEMQAARGALVPGFRGLFQEQIQNFEDLLVEWVETEKRKDERDADKSDEEIAQLISYILLSPTVGAKGEEARKKLLPHIEAFLAKRAASGLSPERSSEWLRAILAAWREMVCMLYPVKVLAELHGRKGDLL